MQISPEAATKTVLICETEFTIPMPYTPEMFEGVPAELGSTEIMAKKANQTLTEDLTNNWRSRCKPLFAEEKPLPTQADLDAYIAEYMPGVRASAGPSIDPVEREALRLAKVDLRSQLRTKRNIKVAKKGVEAGEGEVSFEKFESMASKIATEHPAYAEKAKANLAAKADAVVDLEL